MAGCDGLWDGGSAGRAVPDPLSEKGLLKASLSEGRLGNGRATGALRSLPFWDAQLVDPGASGTTRLCNGAPCVQQGRMFWVYF